MAHGKAGKPGIDIEFNGIEVYPANRVRIVINSKSIWVSDDGKEFLDESSKTNARSIFGKNANPNIVMIEAKWALAEILKDFKTEIEDALAKRHAI